jgi:hypothetical protein
MSRFNRSSVLSQVLFHGSHADLQPGDIVSPREHEHAYAFGSARPASEFGSVYQVAPIDPVEKRQETVKWRRENPMHMSRDNVHTSKRGFQVVKVVNKK